MITYNNAYKCSAYRQCPFSPLKMKEICKWMKYIILNKKKIQEWKKYIILNKKNIQKWKKYIILKS